MKYSEEQKFKEFISQQFKVSKKKIPFYLYWIKLYRNFTENSDLTDAKLDQFLKNLQSKYQDWQVIQADKDISMYHSYLRKEDNSNNPIQVKKNSDWKNAIFNAREEMRLQNKSLQTEHSYLYWIKNFGRFMNMKEPSQVNQDDVKSFLTPLAVERSVAISTQKQAFNSILFLFRHVLHKQIDNLDSVVRSRVKKRLPLILSRNEIADILKHLEKPYILMAEIIYGGGLRLSECLNLRIKDIDFQNNILTIKSGKGDKDRQTLISGKTALPLKEHIQNIRKIYEDDRFENRPGVALPNFNNHDLHPCSQTKQTWSNKPYG